jgi:uncharacterized protein YjbJ (UPF0337 family)
MRSIAILAACAAFTVGTLPTIVHAQATGQTSQTDAKTIWEKFKGSWNQTKGAVKEQWGKLTDDDLDVVAGRRDRLAGKIQERYGVAKDEAEKQLAEWERKATDSWFTTDENRT